VHRAWALGERRDRPGSTKNGTDRSLYRMKGTKLQPAAVRRSRRDEHRRISHWVDCTPLQRTWLFPKITNRSAVAITSGNGSDLRKLSRKSAGPERLVSAGNEGFAQACWNLVAGVAWVPKEIGVESEPVLPTLSANWRRDRRSNPRPGPSRRPRSLILKTG
jgi:hypothetical protein